MVTLGRKADVEVSKSAVDREKKREGEEELKEEKEERKKKGTVKKEWESMGEDTAHLHSHHIVGLWQL